MLAPQAAGVIHTDFEKGFIRAEVISFNDRIQFKTEQACREAGKISIEGKNYTVKDGDVIHFRFNVLTVLPRKIARGFVCSLIYMCILSTAC